MADRTVLLLGNEKVGKSVLFERLTAGAPRERRVAGSRLAVAEGRLAAGRLSRLLGRLRRRAGGAPDVGRLVGDEAPTRLLDPPGVTGLFSRGEDAQLSRAWLLSGEVDAVLLVADTKNLRRSLALFLQVAEFGLPVVLDLNMQDEAEGLGLSVDLGCLAERLGVEVTTSVATEGHGVARLPRLLARARRPGRSLAYAPAVTAALAELTRILAAAPVSPRLLGLLLLLGDPRAEALLAEGFGRGVAREVARIRDAVGAELPDGLDQALTEAAYTEAETLVVACTRRDRSGPATLGWLGRQAEHPVSGLVVAALVLALGYLFVGELGAGWVVDQIDRRLFQEWLTPAVTRGLADLPWPLLRDAIVDPEFGLIPTGLFLALGIVLPVLFFFYLFFALLEDSGYLPRLSVLLDRSLRRLGLNGRGVLPLVLGLSCVTMALLTTRMLETRKERIIASLMLLGFPCAPMLAVMLVALQPLAWTGALTLFLVVGLRVVLAGLVANRVLPGRLPEFILELPPMRRPRLRVILPRTGQRTYLFLREALPIFLLASLLLFALDRLGGLAALEQVAHPLVHGFLGLPDQAVQVFLKTLIRRENGAAELALVRSNFDGVQILVTLVVMTFFSPCVNAVIVLFKEQGLRVGLALLAVVMAVALVAGGTLNWACRLLGVTFG